MKILVSANSFKECASSPEISNIIYNNIRKYFNKNEFEILVKPISDGGDAFLEVCALNNQLCIVNFEIPTPTLNNKLICPVGISKDGKKAFIESAKVLGLAVLPNEFRDPKILSSYGLGILLKKIIKKYKSLKTINIGIGGTAVNDMGIGALAALGLEIKDEHNNLVTPIPKNVDSISNIKTAHLLSLPKLNFVIDVKNPLLGEFGSTRFFGLQKGIKENEFEIFDSFFEKIIKLSAYNANIGQLWGAGGGIVAGFQLFYKINVDFAENFIIKTLGINKTLAPDVIITGEGKLDEQSFMNKGIGVLLKEFEGIPTYIICGKNETKIEEKNVKIFELAKYFDSIEESINNYETGIKQSCKEICEDILFNQKVN